MWGGGQTRLSGLTVSGATVVSRRPCLHYATKLILSRKWSADTFVIITRAKKRLLLRVGQFQHAPESIALRGHGRDGHSESEHGERTEEFDELVVNALETGENRA